VNNPDEQPNTTPSACPAPGRRRAANTSQSPIRRQARTRDACPQRPRLLDPDHEAFVDWFVLYWRRRGAQLFANQPTGTEA
jgi:hypothetical protein